MRIPLLFFIGFCWIASTLTVYSQQLSGITARWSDAFTEWVIFAEDADGPGELRLRWSSQDDWTEWEYRMGDALGQVRLKWGDDKNEWEIRGENQIVSARTLWKDDFREWRITDNTQQITLRSRYGNTRDEWEIRDADVGLFNMYTAYQGDPRDWIIVDELDASISTPMKMALVFIALYNSIPKQ